MIELLQKKSKILLWISFCGLWLYQPATAATLDGSDNSAFWQDRTVTGTIKGDDGQPLPGATVVVKGTANGTTSDADGNFSLSVPGTSATLVVSFIGYMTQEVEIGNQTSINITLKEDAQTLNEVVVTGYGEVRKSDYTGAVSSIKGDELVQLPIQRADQALQGRAAGVMVVNTDGSPGGNTSIRIRGSNSVTGSNSALIVIDGLQGGDLKSLNPNDIESIEVLKDASATAIYGSQGANGVIVITTKKGRNGPPVFNYNVSFGVQELRKKLDLMNAADFAKTTNAFRATQDANGPLDPRFTDAEVAQFEAKGGTDWQNEIYRTGTMQNHQLSIGGGSDRVKYFVSGGYLDQKGILINSAYKRYSLRSNIGVDINKWSSFGMTYAGTKELGNSPPFGEGAGIIDPLGQTTGTAPRWAPTVPVYDELGNYILKHPTGYGAANSWNPVASAKEPFLENNRIRNLLNAFLDFKPVKGLTLRISGGATIENNNNYRYFNQLTYAGASSAPSPGEAQLVASTYARYQNTNNLTYDTRFGNHHLTASVIAEQNVQQTKTYTISGNGYVNHSTGANDFGSAALVTGSSSVVKRVLSSYLGRFNYSFADKYVLTASYRADGSSVFGSNNKWGYFPSVGAAWTLSEESFIKDMDVFTNLKLRTSWGVTGNQAINPYQTIAQLTSIDPDNAPLKYPYNGMSVSENAYYLALPANNNLKWESTKQFNIGLDFGFFNGRLTGSLEYYSKETNDLLLARTLPAYTGYTSILSNVGSMQNKGVEVTLGGNPLVGAVKWSTGLTFSANRSKVLSLGELTALEFRTTTGGGYNFSNSGRSLMNLKVGHPLGEMTGWKVDGTWSESEREQAAAFGQLPGDQKYVDLNNDGLIDTKDLTVIGNALPKFIFGWTNTISYKNFDLNFLIQGSYGNDLFNAGRIRLEAPGEGTSAALLDRWTASNQNTDIPAFTNQSVRTAANLPTGKINSRLLGRTDNRVERYVEDASYARLKNITLAYSLPNAFGSKITKLRLYVSAANLFTIASYTGYDPETSSFNNNDARAGIDFSNYPTAKTYTFGIDLTF
ncbi:MAG TPA: TonB-dependent receptor [Cyclobacteriaceae bacterium]|nr:TonB-dependent receptor [Cyclobacteriaceae bacterium]